MRRIIRYYAAFVAVALAAGCSLVNSLDDVKPADDGTYTGIDRPDGAAILLQDSSSPTGLTDGGSEASNPTGQPISPLVVGGEVSVDGSLVPVLTVLDSKTGKEYGTREQMWVAAVTHEGARDLWYIFEAQNYFVAAPTETMKIHVRKLDPVTAAWTELAVFTTDAPLVYYDAVAITTERLSWVAHPATGQSTFRLVSLSTTNPSNPALSSTTTLEAMPRGVSAVPKSGGVGGFLSLLNMGTTGSSDCISTTTEAGAPLTSCGAKIRHYNVSDNSAPLVGTALPFGATTAQGQPGYGTLFCTANRSPDDITVLPGIGDETGIQTIHATGYQDGTEDLNLLAKFQMKTQLIDGGVVAPTILRKAAIANKYRTVFVVEANTDTQLYAIPLGTPGVVPASPIPTVALLHSGQSVYYDPSSETVFAPFNQGGTGYFTPYHIALQPGATFTVNDPAPAKITLIQRNQTNDWAPPGDLRPLILGIHQPVDPFAECQ